MWIGRGHNSTHDTIPFSVVIVRSPNNFLVTRSFPRCPGLSSEGPGEHMHQSFGHWRWMSPFWVVILFTSESSVSLASMNQFLRAWPLWLHWQCEFGGLHSCPTQSIKNDGCHYKGDRGTWVTGGDSQIFGHRQCILSRTTGILKSDKLLRVCPRTRVNKAVNPGKCPPAFTNFSDKTAKYLLYLGASTKKKVLISTSIFLLVFILFWLQLSFRSRVRKENTGLRLSGRSQKAQTLS